MNNIVEIVYSKIDRFPKISINGEQISRYTELSDLIFDDIYNWADKLYESMDDELCESYSVVLTGHRFHNIALKALQPRSQYCSEVRFSPIVCKIPMADTLAYASELNQQYRLGVRPCAECVQFFTDEPERFQDLVPCTTEPGNYYITAGTQLPARNAKCCVMLSEQLHFEKTQGVSVLHVPAHLLSDLVDYLNLYHFQLEFLSNVFSAVKDLSLSENARMQYEAYLHEEYRIVPNTLPQTMSTGEQFRLTYMFYPQQFGDPQITVGTSDPGVLFASGNTLIGQRAGSANVFLIDKRGIVHGNYTVTVEHHNYVTDISVVLPATSLRVKEAFRFKCLVFPADAEDAHQLRYSISDPSVVAFSGPNELYGIAPGRVKVTVSSARVSKDVYLTVFPTATDVLLPGGSLVLPVNATAYIDCSVVPANANPMPTVSWESSNPRLVRILERNGTSCVVASTLEAGSSVLTCSLDGTDIYKCMKIEVQKEAGCYVATAVYGSYDCPQVWVLRRYRDQFLASSRLGRAFIKFYYTVSPVAVKWFGKTIWFNRLWRGILDSKIRKLKDRGYEDTPYND